MSSTMLLPWFLIAVLSVACTDLSDVKHGWLGRRGSELVHVWGQPTEEVVGGGAARTLVYVSYWSGGFFESYTCRRVFTIDDDVIRRFSMSGCQEGDVRS
jgi:hypothetical protein